MTDFDPFKLDGEPTRLVVFEDGSSIRLRVASESTASYVEGTPWVDAQEGDQDTTPDPVLGKEWARNNTPGKKGFQRTASGSGSFQERLGRCYELAGKYVAFDNHEATLVHGTIQGAGNPPLDHAWAELPNGDVWEPTTNTVWPGPAFKAFFHPVPRVRYSAQEVTTTILRTEHWGPWDEAVGAKERDLYGVTEAQRYEAGFE